MILITSISCGRERPCPGPAYPYCSKSIPIPTKGEIPALLRAELGFLQSVAQVRREQKDDNKPLTGTALIKETCRRIRVALCYRDAHNNRACRGEWEKALALCLMIGQLPFVPLQFALAFIMNQRGSAEAAGSENG